MSFNEDQSAKDLLFKVWQPNRYLILILSTTKNTLKAEHARHYHSSEHTKGHELNNTFLNEYVKSLGLKHAELKTDNLFIIPLILFKTVACLLSFHGTNLI